MSHPLISRRAAAALFLERQQLDRPRGRRLTAASLAGFARATGGVQLDSINVVDRAHYLTLWSRFGAFDRTKLDRLIYRKRVLFEYWSHVACLVGTDDFPAWRRAMLDYQRRHKSWGAWLKKHDETLRIVENEIRVHGPLGTAHFEQPPGQRAAGWWNWKPAAHALEYLWMSGVVTIHSRRHFHKRFDLLERVFPDRLAAEPMSSEAFRRWHFERSLHAMGAASETDLGMYMTFPRQPAVERRTQLRALVREGVVTEIAVEGMRGTWFALTRDLPELARAGSRRAPSFGTTFLSPFDSFLWHRERVQKLFGFNYRIEVYVPAAKRKYGYYVLPLIHDGHFIGRADVKTHRVDGVLEIRAIHFEDWFVAGVPPPAAGWGTVDRVRALAGTAAAMRSLATFVGVGEVKLGTVMPRALR
ncbi:MAG: crosslink repair DNA glycosylase YcaQ family protein, partial [Candidatus Eisenbacteria bacterium]